jgi:hypothetical protein
MVKRVHEDIERRMLNWKRWKLTDGVGVGLGLGYGAVGMWSSVVVDCAGRVDSRVPTNSVEASETDQAVELLPVLLRDTVRVYWLTDHPVEVKARMLGCAVSTVHSRVREANVQLTALIGQRGREQAMQRQALACEQERLRLAGLGRAASVVIVPAEKVSRRRK